MLSAHDDYLDYETDLSPDWQPTTTQLRYLREIRAAGERTYNGRAGKSLRALQRMGLISFTFDLIPQASGRYAERYTARPL